MKTQKAPKPPNRKNGTLKALAEALGLTTRQISTLLAEGCPENPADALTWYGLKTRSATDAEDDSPAALRRKRILYLDEQTRLLQFHIRQKEGELVEVTMVREVALAVSSVARAKFLKLPHELPSRISGLSESKCQKIIHEAIVEILTELSEESLKAFE